MLGNGVEMSLIFRQILGALVLGWAPNNSDLGAKLAPGIKKVSLYPCSVDPDEARWSGSTLFSKEDI